MHFQPPAVTSLTNESDVETMVLMPLMSSDEPYGLRISVSSISGKANLRRFRIGKGSSSKNYFPDFLVIARGLPVAVIEAKAPGESVEEGFREARLYASELNAVFSTGINSAQIVIATDGSTLMYGRWDQELPLGTVRISADLGRIFNPNSRSDRSFIAKCGYIPSLRRERYVDPIDRVIRAAKPPSEIHSTLIENTSRPAEVIALLRDTKPLEHQVLLIVGSVGSGKTTFIDHLEEVALP